MTKTTDATYYATPDPDQPAQMTFWRLTAAAEIVAHPSTSEAGPRLGYVPGPGVTVVPRLRTAMARREWISRWQREVRRDWETRVRAAIDADPDDAAARFGALTSRCCCCGRVLTDPTSRVYAIGPECRAGLPDAVLAAYARAVGRAHASAPHTQVELWAS
jgi:hypothetical protein